MSEQFDPYHSWLGIPAKDQPPQHYRLLGVETLENKGGPWGSDLVFRFCQPLLDGVDGVA